MNRMLINAAHKDQELRIALASGQFLYDLIIESTSRKRNLSNVYKGKITRIERSLEAAFVDYGEDRHGFLPLKEIARSCFKNTYSDSGRRPSINDVIDEGQEMIVQVEKEERGNKGAALTTFISLPGSYLVLMPNNPRAGGVSRRIEGDERDELQTILSSLQAPEDMGLIVRTAGGGRSIDELQWDLEILLRLWNVIQTTAAERPAPFLIYQEGNAVIRAMRDYLRKDIDEILIDQVDAHEDVIEHLKLVRPDFVSRVKLYQDATPLFTRFQIESQIESAFQREVRLPSGGSITIDHTEALVSIDVNSAKATKGGDIEETAVITNLEAANEIARQLRLRDIGGLVVIDFIDMTPIRNKEKVRDALYKALQQDRARVQIGTISRFGLLEMSRQRLRPSLGESSRVTCPRCEGQGTIRGIESLGLSVMRVIEEEAIKENTAQVRAILPTDIAAYLLNEKRQAIFDIEKRQNVTVIIVPSQSLLTPKYEVERIRLSDLSERDEKLPSYKLTPKPPESAGTHYHSPASYRQQQEPAVKSVSSDETPPPAPTPVASYAAMSGSSPKPARQPGLLKKVMTFLFEKKEQNESSTTQQPSTGNYQQQQRPQRTSGRRHGQGQHRGRRDRGRHSGHSHRQYENRDNRQRDSRPHRERHGSDQHTSHTQQPSPQPQQTVDQSPPANTPVMHSVPQTYQAPNPPIALTSASAAPKNDHIVHEAVTSNAPEEQQQNTAPSEKRQHHRRRYHHRHRYNRQKNHNKNNAGPTTEHNAGEDIYNKKEEG